MYGCGFCVEARAVGLEAIDDETKVVNEQRRRPRDAAAGGQRLLGPLCYPSMVGFFLPFGLFSSDWLAAWRVAIPFSLSLLLSLSLSLSLSLRLPKTKDNRRRRDALFKIKSKKNPHTQTHTHSTHTHTQSLEPQPPMAVMPVLHALLKLPGQHRRPLPLLLLHPLPLSLPPCRLLLLLLLLRIATALLAPVARTAGPPLLLLPLPLPLTRALAPLLVLHAQETEKFGLPPLAPLHARRQRPPLLRLCACPCRIGARVGMIL
jgi:hypothetical protein